MVPLMTTSVPDSQITVENLCARRGDRLVFENLTVSLSPGQAAIVTGPNGSGKSTFLRILAGLLAPYKGEVNIGAGGPGNTCFAGHLDGLKGALTVAENLRFWTDIYGATEGTLTAAASLMDLETVADMPADILSAGWRRRIGLTRLLLSGAPAWILDEPFTALDAENVARLETLLGRHLEGGGTLVLATHQETVLPAQYQLDMRDFAPPHPLIQDSGW